MILTTAVMLLGVALPTQADNSRLVACNQAFAPTRSPLSTRLPPGPDFERCIEISGWGDSARAVPGAPGGGAGQVVLDAFSVRVDGEGPELMLLRQRLLQGQPLSGALVLWQVKLVNPYEQLAKVALQEVFVQSVTTAVDPTGNRTTLQLQPRAVIWEAWSTIAPGPGGSVVIRYTHNFRDP